MLGRTPPAAMVTEPSSFDSSSSLRTASWMWRGTMRVFLLSRAAVAGQLQDLSGQILQHGGQVHGGAGTDTLGVLALLQEPRNAAHWELQARLGGLADGLLRRLAFATSGHDCCTVCLCAGI